jgi:hypothetical protein
MIYTDNLSDHEVQRNLNSEIKRYDIINYLIEKHNLVNYLEIGVFKGENIREVKAPHKDGVDPGSEGVVPPEVNYHMTSNEFFDLIKGHEDIKYDIIFIDGLHEYSQVKKDIENSLKHLQPKGFIVMHDCNPVSHDAQLPNRQTVAWNGDVWKAFVEFKQNNLFYECCVIDTDFGVGVIKNNVNPIYSTPLIDMDYQTFDNNRKRLLNLVTWDEFKTTH